MRLSCKLNIFYTQLIVFIFYIANQLSDGVFAQEEGLDWKKVDAEYYGPKFVNEKQTFQISCQMSQFKAPKWTLNELPISESKRISFNNRIGIQMTRIETIVVSNASAYDSGFYRCNSFSRNYHRLDVITSEPISSTADPIPEPNIAFEEIKEELSTVVLKCHILSKAKDNEIFWFKNGIKIEIDDRRTVEKSNLIIRDATSVVDSGDYLCRVDSLSSRGGSQFGQMIQLRAPIRVKPFPNTDSVAEGDRRVIRCEYTGYPVGKIRWLIGNQKLSYEDMRKLGIEIRADVNSHPDALLIIRNATQFHTNSYTCIVSNRYSEDETSVLLSVRDNDISTNSPMLLAENKALNIVCNFTNHDQHVLVIWKWYKEDVEYNSFSDEDKQRISIDPKDGSLFISKANKNDIGNWKCESPTDPNLFTKIIVRSKPWMYLFEEFQKTNYKSANIVEGQRFHLKCQVMEDYTTDAWIEWFMFNESDYMDPRRHMTRLLPDTNPRIKIVFENQTLSTLTIDSVVPTDRYYYLCISHNGVSSVNNTILLRVKDKLGALWPFLGIVAEVVILCTIIFIYEKRRIKPDFDDSDDNNTEPKASQDRSSKSQDVRQRK